MSAAPRRPPVLTRTVVALYPRGWRRRYGAELEALADESPSRPRALADLARGAWDARRHPELAPEDGVPQARPRQAICTMLMAATTVGLVTGGFVKLSEDVTFRGASAAGDVTLAGAVIAAVGVAALVAGPLIETVRWAVANRCVEVGLRALRIVGATCTWLLVTALLARSADSLHGPLAGIVFLAWCAIGCCLTWIAAHAAGSALLIPQIDLPVASLDRGLWVVVTGAVIALGGLSLWGLLAAARAGFGQSGLGGLPLGVVWPVLLLAMCAAIGVLWSLARNVLTSHAS